MKLLLNLRQDVVVDIPDAKYHQIVRLGEKQHESGERLLKSWIWQHQEHKFLPHLRVRRGPSASPSSCAVAGGDDGGGSITCSSTGTCTETLTEDTSPQEEPDDNGFADANDDLSGMDVETDKDDEERDGDCHQRLQEVCDGTGESGESSACATDRNHQKAPRIDAPSVCLGCLQKNRVLSTISHIHRLSLEMKERRVVSEALLDGLVNLTDSEYGFIAEYKRDESGNPFLLCQAITNISWNAATQAFYEENIESGLRFYNMKALFGPCVMREEIVIANNPKEHPASAGTPTGHPSLDHFLGIPFFEETIAGNEKTKKLLGMVGIANKPGGYSQADVESLEPFLATVSTIIQRKHWINTLEHKVEERTRELKEANTRLEQANRSVVQASEQQLKHFACMSHEIRTPLNCVVGLSSLLRDTELNERQRESVDMIIASGTLLSSIVNDVLDFSRLATGHIHMDIRNTSLQETLDAVVNAIDIKACERDLEFVTMYAANVPAFLNTDGRRLQQILYNLLGNAIKFSSKGGRVELKVERLACGHAVEACELSEDIESKSTCASQASASEAKAPSRCPFHKPQNASHQEKDASAEVERPRGKNSNGGRKVTVGSCQQGKDCSDNQGSLRFMVKDYGQGIKDSDLQGIFEPFGRGSAEDRDQGEFISGTGLGLAITSSIVKHLGGSISVESELGAWSSFTVEIPLCTADQEILASDVKGDSTEIPCSPCPLRGSGDLPRLLVISSNEAEKDAITALRSYGMTMELFNDMTSAKLWIDGRESGNNVAPWFCLVQEELFDASAYNSLCKALPPLTLITFGHERCITESARHFRSMTRVVPSVVLRFMIHMINEQNEARQTQQTANRKCWSSSMDQSFLSPTTRRASSSKFSNVPRADFGPIRVLIAEDNRINQKVLLRMLKRLGLKHVDVVDDGQQACEQVTRKQYDIILMDMQMPVMDGLEACRHIVHDTQLKTPLPKIVFVTAHVSTSFEATAREAGGDGFIPKPFNLQTMEELFQSVAIGRT